MSAPLLILAVGNPSRGDDALGPMLLERLQAQSPQDVQPDVARAIAAAVAGLAPAPEPAGGE